MKKLLSSHRTLLGLGAALAVAAGAVGAAPAAAQPSTNFSCLAVSPPEETCHSGICMFKYRECQLDFNDDEEFERIAYFFADRGDEVLGLFAPGDRRCYQGNNFIATATEPDIEDLEYGYHRFILVFPEGFDPELDSGPLPIYIDIRQGTAGWVDQDVGAGSVNSWALDFSITPESPTWEQGAFRDRLELAQPDFSEQNMLMRMLDPSGFEAELRQRDDPSYAFLILSGCSFDCHNGRPALGVDAEDFVEAERTRFSYIALLEALRFVREEYDGIDHFYAGAQSGGGKGAFILARDLPDLEDFDDAGLFRGAIMASAPAEFDDLATLFARGDTIRVDTDDVCELPAQEEAQVPADHGGEPLATAFEESGASGYSASGAILTNAVEDVPILHVWNIRDPAHAYDACYSEAFIHGPIRDEIEARKDLIIDEPFEFSENMEVCIGSCNSLDAVPVPVHCVTHGLMEEVPVIDCALDWIDEINAYWASDGVDAYTTPASCASPEPMIDLTPDVACRDQNDM